MKPFALTFALTFLITCPYLVAGSIVSIMQEVENHCIEKYRIEYASFQSHLDYCRKQQEKNKNVEQDLNREIAKYQQKIDEMEKTQELLVKRLERSTGKKVSFK